MGARKDGKLESRALFGDVSSTASLLDSYCAQDSPPAEVHLRVPNSVVLNPMPYLETQR